MDAKNNKDNEQQYRTVGWVVGGQLFERTEPIEKKRADK